MYALTMFYPGLSLDPGLFLEQHIYYDQDIVSVYGALEIEKLLKLCVKQIYIILLKIKNFFTFTFGRIDEQGGMLNRSQQPVSCIFS